EGSARASLGGVSAPPPVRPDVSVDLDWEGDLRFRARAGGVEVVLDSDGRAGPSPVQALAMALAGCMAIDLVHILRKGRLDVRAVQAALAAERASADPRRLVRVRLHFPVAADLPPPNVDTAIAPPPHT